MYKLRLLKLQRSTFPPRANSYADIATDHWQRSRLLWIGPHPDFGPFVRSFGMEIQRGHPGASINSNTYIKLVSVESMANNQSNINHGTVVGLWFPGSPSSRVILPLLVSSLPLETVRSIQIPPTEVVVQRIDLATRPTSVGGPPAGAGAPFC